MDNNIIDYGQINIPTSWDDIPLRMFQDIERYYSDKDKEFDIREVLHIITDKSVDEINALPMEITEILMDKLSFLSQPPKEAESSNKIEIDGEVYVINVMEQLRTGEFISIDTIMKQDKYDYASILAVLCRKEGEVYDSKFEAELFDKRKEMFEKQPIMKVMPTISFFLNCYILSTAPSLLCLKVEQEINRIAKSIKTSKHLGVFKRQYLKWRIRTLRKSLKSSKSI